MARKWKLKALAALTMAVGLSACEMNEANYNQFLQAQMQWNATRKAELGINDSVGAATSVEDRRAIFGGFFTEGLGLF